MSETPRKEKVWKGFRESCRKVIFYSDRPLERLFDVALIVTILASVLVVMLESVASIRARWAWELYVLEWFFTGLFTVEYALRLYVSEKPLRYARSFFGVVDLIAILPTYLDLILPGSRYLMSVRAIRVLRVFRVLKMTQFVGEANLLTQAIRQSARKITVFVFSILTLVSILGSVMYLIEGPTHGFTSIPKAVYWAIVTLTTVGYGDISPQTTPGQCLASVIMILGYGIIAVPTGIVTAEITRASLEMQNQSRCPECGLQGHVRGARYCRSCGHRFEEEM